MDDIRYLDLHMRTLFSKVSYVESIPTVKKASKVYTQELFSIDRTEHRTSKLR